MALAVLGAIVPAGAALGAQAALSAAAEGHNAPGGVVVLSVSAGTKVAVVSTKGANALVTVEGWVDASRLAGALDTFPASVDSKATLRVRGSASATGAILAELHPRIGVRTLGKSGTWTRIRRSAWIPASALPKPEPVAAPKAVTAPAKTAAPPPTKAAKATEMPRVTAAATPQVKAAVTPPAKPAVTPAAPAQAAAAATVAPMFPGAMSAAKTTKLLIAPGGAVVGELAQGAIVMPLAHDHGWAKVRVEAWVPDADLSPADSSLGSRLSAADLRADPEATHGKTVQWDVQILSLQIADPLRPEMARDEPYLLAKGPGAEDALLYLAVPPSLLAQAKALPPLTRVLITARVRSGHSEPVGIPILDLRSISKR
jgi:hypothetical protein